MYCKNCGKEIKEDALYCSNCGARQDPILPQKEETNTDFWFSVLGFLIPLAGLIVFLVYEGKKPGQAKAAAKGALIGVIVKVALSALITLFSLIFFRFLLLSDVRGTWCENSCNRSLLRARRQAS